LFVVGRERDGPPEVSGGIDLVDVGAASAVLRVTLQEGYLPADPLRQGDVVTVHLGDVRALRALHPDVPGTYDTQVHLVPDGDDPAVLLGVGGYDTPGVVGRAVIDDQKLNALVGLVKDALDGVGEEPRRVVDRHHHRNEDLLHKPPHHWLERMPGQPPRCGRRSGTASGLRLRGCAGGSRADRRPPTAPAGTRSAATWTRRDAASAPGPRPPASRTVDTDAGSPRRCPSRSAGSVA